MGSGAQGAVFLGKFHGEEVAVKKVRDIKETEIKHLRKLKHPNIITFKCETIADILLQQSFTCAALNVPPASLHLLFFQGCVHPGSLLLYLDGILCSRPAV